MSVREVFRIKDEMERKAREKSATDEAEKYAESCDNESGSFLSHHLIAIRKKAFRAGHQAAMESVKGLVSALEFYADQSNWAGRLIFPDDEERMGKLRPGGRRARSALKAFTERTRK